MSYYKRKKDEVIAASKEYYKNNKDTIKQKFKEYNKEHIDKINENALKWYHENKHRPELRERRIAYSKMYYQANKEKNCERKKEYFKQWYNKKRGLSVSIHLMVGGKRNLVQSNNVNNNLVTFY